MPRGYDQPLYLLPFDHRGTFETKMFGFKEPLTPAQTSEIAAVKGVIYDGFKAAIAAGVPKANAGILVDEQFGADIARDAKSAGFRLANEGRNTRDLQLWLGHKNIQHTVRYTELSPDRFRDFWR